LRKAISPELLPAWTEAMPPAASAELPTTRREGATAVYLPACVNRIFGDGGAMSLPQALVTASERAGRPVWIPADAAGHCCATPWSSKGYADGHAHMADKTVAALWRWSDSGTLPVVIDASSCALGLREEVAERHPELTVIDSVEWASDELLPRLTVGRKLRSVALHPPCSTRHLGLDRKLAALAGSLADDVFVPPTSTCCGFAGDRGFLHPELTAAATAQEASELAGRSFDAYLCSNRTCEIGLEQGTGRPFRSIVYALEELTRT
jgi:D-lactate dehydrogenase